MSYEYDSGSDELTYIDQQSPRGVAPMVSLGSRLSELRLDGPSTPRSDRFHANDVVVDNTGAVVSGSAEALLQRLIPTKDFCPDDNYIFAMLVNIRTLMSPDDVMQRIVQHCMFSVNADATNFAREGRQRLFSDILRLCGHWLHAIPYDFRQEHMKTRLNELLGLCGVDRSLKQKIAELQNELKATLNKLERYEKAVRSLQKTIAENTQQPTPYVLLVGLMPLCNDVKVVAQQLTHIEMERLSMVGLDEIVMSLAKNDISELGRDKNSGTVSTISFYVEWFNRLSSFVATEVLRQQRRKHRVMVIEFYIDVARECCESGNFNSLMAIVAGLSLPAISRLKRTWSRVEKAKLEILQHQLDPSGNFLSYRATIKAAQWRADSARKGETKIVIPFFVLLLKDLFLIYHGSPRIYPNGHINFLGFRELAEQLQSICQWRSAPCTFPKDPQVLQYLLVSPIYGERDSLLTSYDLESADSSTEREHFKKLKLSANGSF